MKQIRGMLSKLTGDVEANILPMTAAGVVLAAGIVGAAVDLSRAYMAQNKLQSACDAGVLAGRRAVATNGYDAVAQNTAANYFQSNFVASQNGAKNTVFASSSSDSGRTIIANASATLDMTLLRVLGKQQMQLAVECSSSMGVGNADITLVLDNTGSMDWTLPGTSQTRIQALRVAMKNFYTSLATVSAGSNSRLRYAFVPFSSSVNVGRLLYNLNPSYLVNSRTIQSRAPVWTVTTSQVFDYWDTPVVTTGTPSTGNFSNGNWMQHSSTQYNSSSSCNSAKPANTAWTNNGSTSTSTSTTANGDGQQVVTTTLTQPQRRNAYSCILRTSNNKWYINRRQEDRDYYTYSYATSDPVYRTVTNQTFDRWEYKPVTWDTSTFKTFAATPTNNGSNGATASYTWAGCIEERSSTPAASFSFSSLLGISPSAADLDIDSAPDGSDSSKWAPMWPQVAYYRTTSGGSMTNSSTSNYGQSAGNYCPRAAQGLAQMTQAEFNAYADSLVATGATYLDVGLAWGARISSPNGIFSATVNDPPFNGGNVGRHMIFMSDGEMDTGNYLMTAWGIEYHDRRVTTDGSKSASDTRHMSRFLALCEAVKAKGIRLWVIAFGTSLTTDLQNCASSASAFSAGNATQLNNTFQEIARQVGELRVVQ